MNAMASQITTVSIVCSTVCSGADQRKYQSSVSLTSVRGIHRWLVNSPHKGPVTWKMFPFDDIMYARVICFSYGSSHIHILQLIETLHFMYNLLGGAQITLLWRHNGRGSISNRQPHDCLLNRLFRRRSKKTSKLCVTGLCVGNSPGTVEFPAQMASNAENVANWWRHHDIQFWVTSAQTLKWKSLQQCCKIGPHWPNFGQEHDGIRI